MASADQLRAAIEAHVAAVELPMRARWRLSTSTTADARAARNGGSELVHTFSGRSALTVKIRRINDDRWRMLTKKLAGAPASRTAAEPAVTPAP